MASLRELLLSIRVKVDKSGIEASDTAVKEATQSAGKLERALQRVAAMHEKIGASQRRINVSNARNDADFAKVTGLNSRAGIAPRAPRPHGIGSMAAPDIFAPAPKELTRLEQLKAKFASTFQAAGAKVREVSDKIDTLAGKLFNARTALAGFAAVIVARGIGEFIGDVIETGKSLAEMSARTRVSVEALQGWRALIAKAGVDTSVLETAFRKLSKASRAATKETSPQAKAFKDLGVSVKNADGSLRPIEDIMTDTGSALAEMTDDTKASAIATQLLGPAGLALVPAFEAGGDAVRKFLAVAKENVSISTEDAKRLKAVGDEVERGGKKWTGLKNKLVTAMLPALEFVAQKFEAVSKWLFDTTKKSEILHTILGALAAGGIAKLVIMLGAWVTKAGGAQAALGILGGGLRSAAGFALRFIAPLLIIEDFLTFLAGGKSLFGRAMNEIFGEGGAKKARTGILDTFTKIGTAINGSFLPALKAIAESDFFKGTLKAVAETILGVLNLIGLAFAKNNDEIDDMGSQFLRNTNYITDAIQSVIDKVEAAGRAFTDFVGITDPSDAPAGPSGPVAPLNAGDATKWFGPAGAEPRFPSNDASNWPGSSAYGTAAPSSQSTVVNNNQQVSVNVTGGDTPGATGRAVAAAVTPLLQTNPRQVLNSVSN